MLPYLRFLFWTYRRLFRKLQIWVINTVSVESGRRMKVKAVSGIMLTLLLTSMLTLAFNIQPVRASGTIYIRADGSVDPDTAPISSIDNVTYTFTDNIYDMIVVERDNIVVDGAGYTLQGTGGTSQGITLEGRSNITIRNMKIEAFWYGILFSDSSNNRISGSNITANIDFGICISWHSHNNTISGNNISNTGYGFLLEDAYGNIISGNKIINSPTAIRLVDSFGNNSISGNTVTNKHGWGIDLYESSNNKIYHNNLTNNTYKQASIEKSGYANFWDDSVEGNYWSDYEDRYPNATELDGSGIWDTPYVIDEYNVDNYPIVPEFPTWASILLIFIVLTFAIAIYKRRLLKTPIP